MGDILTKPFGLFERLSGAEAAKVEAESAQNIAEFNVQVQKREATALRQRATFAQKRQAKKGVEIKSALIAKLGVAGGIGSLVAGDLAAEQAAEIELEGLLIGFEGEIGAQRALTQAQLDRLAGKTAKLRGRNLALARNIQFATTLGTAASGGSFLKGFGRKTAGGSGFTAGFGASSFNKPSPLPRGF